MQTADFTREAPKVVLHDHLDGGLRSETVADLAADADYRGLPGADPDELGRWFAGNAQATSLEDYLDGFTHTVAVMQTRPALTRVACEAVVDAARDNVVYLEVRFAPELHTAAGLSADDVVVAVCEGLADGEQAAAREGYTIQAACLLTAMRQGDQWRSTAQLAHRYRGPVVGFDIAGPERGWPASRGLDVFNWLRARNVRFTIHAGEGFGLPAIADAVGVCGAERLGHGVRLVDDIDDGGGVLRCGPLASYVRDRRIALEVCPTSNVGTGVVADVASHPFDTLYRAGLRVCVNPDNRLMSATSASTELARLCEAFDYGPDDVVRWTLNAAKSAFAPYPARTALIRDVLLPRFARLGARRDLT